MKKYIIIVSIIIVIIGGLFLIKYLNTNAIKEDDIFTNVSVKDYIPYINTKEEICIGIHDKKNDEMYAIIINKITDKSVLSISYLDKKGKETQYMYSWDNIYTIDGNELVIPKGWSLYKEVKNVPKTTRLNSCPIDYINGTVLYTKGNTSLIKKCLKGI